MLILLPPSETKRDGGEPGTHLLLSRLRFPALTQTRRRVLTAVRELAADPERCIAALKLGPRQQHEVTRNRRVLRSATMPALDRYTGVLYDALDAATLSSAERDFAGETVVVHSALLGPVGALDWIPAYRLSHDSRLPGGGLRQLWAAPVREVLAVQRGLILDLRSAGYVRLGAAPDREDSVYLRVVAAAANGQTRALNHFNKQAKGHLARALIRSGALLADTREFLDWGSQAGFTIRSGAPGELEFLVPESQE